MVCQALDIKRETYLAILMDREYKGPVIVACPEGGVDIEEVAGNEPWKIMKVVFLIIYSKLHLEWCKSINKTQRKVIIGINFFQIICDNTSSNGTFNSF